MATGGVIQLIQISPEEFQEAIASRIKSELDALRKDFQPREPEEFLSRQQVADMLDINLGTLHNWTKRGKLKAYGIAGRVYYKRAEVASALTPLEP
jgi:DNA-directed RNA polymerase specialized sigma24 family protein